MQAQAKLKILIQYNENAKVLKIIIQSAIYILSLMKSISLHHIQTESIIIIQVHFVLVLHHILHSKNIPHLLNFSLSTLEHCDVPE